MRPPKKWRRFVNRWLRGRRHSLIYNGPIPQFVCVLPGLPYLAIRLRSRQTGEYLQGSII